MQLMGVKLKFACCCADTAGCRLLSCGSDCGLLWVSCWVKPLCTRKSVHGVGGDVVVWRRYEAFRTLRESDGWDTLPEARRRAVEGELRDFVLGGVALEVRLKILFFLQLKHVYERHYPAYCQPAVGAFSHHCRCSGTCIAFCARSPPQGSVSHAARIAG